MVSEIQEEKFGTSFLEEAVVLSWTQQANVSKSLIWKGSDLKEEIRDKDNNAMFLTIHNFSNSQQVLIERLLWKAIY